MQRELVHIYIYVYMYNGIELNKHKKFRLFIQCGNVIIFISYFEKALTTSLELCFTSYHILVDL